MGQDSFETFAKESGGVMTQEYEARKAAMVKSFETEMWNFIATTLEPEQLERLEFIEKNPVSGVARIRHKKGKKNA